MTLTWALCLLVGAEFTAPQAANNVPPAVGACLKEQPSALPHHQGYLKELARLPEFAESEIAWWRTSQRPGLGELSAQFGEMVGGDPTAEERLDAFYDQLVESPDLRQAVENLFRTELDQARTQPAMARAVQYLRANPDTAMRFLGNPARVRPLPEALRNTYAQFADNPEWARELQGALDDVLASPAAHQTILPWWEKLEAMSPSAGNGPPALPTELYRHPRELWTWHLRNINLSRNRATRPWIRYWNRLIHRNPMLASQYGPFVNELLADPERMRQHLADLEARQEQNASSWPPALKPPKLPPLDMAHPVEQMKRGMTRPTIDKPKRPSRPVVTVPERSARPTPPKFPEFPSLKEHQPAMKNSRPVFPEFPRLPENEDASRTKR
jgi:truncated hemoglobin YjbI